jgi:imidazolonepropionase-like amidohydrolase
MPSHDTCKGLSNLSTKMGSLGLIKLINPTEFEASLPDNTVIHEARGAFVTPGIFDLHSHITVDAGSSSASALQY